jgi:RNA polymerase sigma factor (TIGR02999 family)
VRGERGVSEETPGDIVRLLDAHRSGDPEAWATLIRLVYADLRRLAHVQSGGRPQDRTLNTTSLVNECYLRLLAPAQASIASQQHFFALAACIMRQVMCDYARERLAEKRGGDQQRQSLEVIDQESVHEAEQLIELDDLLRKLAASSPRTCEVFECRYFGGLSEQQTADVLELSLRTVQREWNAGRAWLRERLI